MVWKPRKTALSDSNLWVPVRSEDLGFDIRQVLTAFDDKIRDQLRVLGEDLAGAGSGSGSSSALECGDSFLQDGIRQGIFAQAFQNSRDGSRRRVRVHVRHIRGSFQELESRGAVTASESLTTGPEREVSISLRNSLGGMS